MNSLMRMVRKELWSFTKELARVVLRSAWWTVKSIATSAVIVAGMVYLWCCFGTGQPQRYLSGHEAWAVVDQAMRNIHEKGCPR